MNSDQKLKFSLLGLRLTVLIVFAVWTADKFVNPEHAAGIFKKFYFLPIDINMSYLIGGAQAFILLVFLLGKFKFWTYGALLVFHAVSTFSSFTQYLNPYDGANILFFAAWPMLGGLVALFLLREEDTLFNLSE